MLKGRLGLSGARVPHKDRHGLMWLERGNLTVEAGNVVFATAGSPILEAGNYQLPFQTVSFFLLGPGVTVSHDVMRLLARHSTGMVAVGERGVRLYASMPFGPDNAELGRAQALLWSDEGKRIEVARRMFQVRLGELLPQRDLNALRGVEGHRMKAVYKNLAERFGVKWEGRRFDRSNPDGDDDINSAINHASVAVRSAAMVAVAVTGAIPQLGFIHESSGNAFCLDIADLYRASLTLAIAFECTAKIKREPHHDLERLVRRTVAERMWRDGTIPDMIDNIKGLLNADDLSGDPKRS